jgi:hypothetical protein
MTQALFNLTYIQALCSIVSRMSLSEQRAWSTITNHTSDHVRIHTCSYLRQTMSTLFRTNSKSITIYLRMIALAFIQARFHANTDYAEVHRSFSLFTRKTTITMEIHWISLVTNMVIASYSNIDQSTMSSFHSIDSSHTTTFICTDGLLVGKNLDDFPILNVRL